MKKVAIMQPTFFPWLGYFSLLNAVDEFIFLDDVQFEKRSWQQRNRIKISDELRWLTIPVNSKGKYDQIINDVTLIESQKHKNNILKTIYHTYNKSKNFEKIYSELELVVLTETDKLVEFNIGFIDFVCKLLKINTILTKSSSLNCAGMKDERLVNICILLSSKHYIAPPGSEQYIVEGNHFNENKIKVSYFYYEHPIYHQLGKNFISHLSILDLIMNEEIQNIINYLNLYKLK